MSFLLDWFREVFIDNLDTWAILGFIAQMLFMMRFVVQWITSERRGKSVVPIAFWFFSIGGGLLMLVYVIGRKDPVLIAGQSMGIVIYARNLWLIYREKRQTAR
ncbi:MAG: lipid-A-disaccharide synthase N-terminal domain-containing protein [Cohaesibacteraceae bacterium]|nr:lipid-A-disaccharide synthase N-terminal domain-containing protein [Cohaesibacteraceae bacterium]MBL4875095.1 lipid-A-disaccharide synthase N-terminal domain-containing protein [Cohaesibacteraceae bacterium]MBL4877182.1 lipid-A-disaccharide synthase N-terminal domain-containing protein [Cohaesibacteraceae bacterium]